jgi:hypothetical protein
MAMGMRSIIALGHCKAVELDDGGGGR